MFLKRLAPFLVFAVSFLQVDGQSQQQFHSFPFAVEGFIENSGQLYQVSDEMSEINYTHYIQSRNFTTYLSNKGFDVVLSASSKLPKSDGNVRNLVFDSVEISKKTVRFNFVNAGTASLISQNENKKAGILHFYTGSQKGQNNTARIFKSVDFYEAWPGIGVNWSYENDAVRYDFTLTKAALYREIVISVEYAKSINIDEEGFLNIETELGIIKQSPPIAIQKGKKTQGNWKVKGNLLSFEFTNILENEAMKIDPTIRVWGTYYGGTATEIGNSCQVDKNGNVYIIGSTKSSAGIATTGSTWTGDNDAFIAKFDSAGNRLWGFYFGGNQFDYGNDLAIDTSLNVFVTGYTASDGLATINAYQQIRKSSADGFVAKIDTFGRLIWATYYGDTMGTFSNAIAIDDFQNIVIGGSYYPTWGAVDMFVAKFLNNGTFLWNNSFGGIGTDDLQDIAVDSRNNIYLCGTTGSINMATNGSHQQFLGSNADALLIKLNKQGTRLWATYYGGNVKDFGRSCMVDNLDNVYITGTTLSQSGISTPGSWKAVLGAANLDAFLAKLDSNGVRIFGTYFGGISVENAVKGCIDQANRIHIIGNAAIGLTTLLPTQNVFGGGQHDAFVVTFLPNGIPVFATYLGGGADDYGLGIASYKASDLYVCGNTQSATGIGTSGIFKPTLSAGINQQDAFLSKYNICAVDIDVTQNGSSYTASAQNASFQWIDCNSGQLINNATAATFNATGNGSFAVVVSQYGCVDTSQCNTLLNFGLLENEANSWFVSPNPATSVTTVSISQKDINSELIIYNVKGQIYFKKILTDLSTDIDVSKWPAGLYFYSINGVSEKVAVF